MAVPIRCAKCGLELDDTVLGEQRRCPRCSFKQRKGRDEKSQDRHHKADRPEEPRRAKAEEERRARDEGLQRLLEERPPARVEEERRIRVREEERSDREEEAEPQHYKGQLTQDAGAKEERRVREGRKRRFPFYLLAVGMVAAVIAAVVGVMLYGGRGDRAFTPWSPTSVPDRTPPVVVVPPVPTSTLATQTPFPTATVVHGTQAAPQIVSTPTPAPNSTSVPKGTGAPTVPPNPTATPETTFMPEPTVTLGPTAVPTPAPPTTIKTEITNVSFGVLPSGGVYTLTVKVGSTGAGPHGERTARVTTPDDVMTEHTAHFTQSEGYYQVLVPEERIPTSDTDWVRENVTVEILLESVNGLSSPTLVPTAQPTLIPTPSPVRALTPTPTLAPTTTIQQGTPSASLVPRSTSWISNLENQIHLLVNEQWERPLTLNSQLSDIARAHSTDMAIYGYFSHDNRSGQSPSDRATQTGYRCFKDFGSYYREEVAENIFHGYLYSTYRVRDGVRVDKDYYTVEELARETVDGWMASPGHRENILNLSYDWEGIGVAVSDDEEVYVTQDLC